MNHPLDTARIKMVRAEEHLRALEHEIGSYLGLPYLETNPYEFTARWQGSQRVPTIRLHVPPPTHLSAIVGDCLFNLRSSLELTFWALTRQTGPKDPDRDRISFPIFANELKFRAAEDGFGRLIPSEALEVLEQVQPFRTRNVALSILRTLSNQDKHGFLKLTLTCVPQAGKPTACLVLENSVVPSTSIDVLLQKIFQHIRSDVLPKFAAILP